MKKASGLILSAALLAGLLAGCAGQDKDAITVITRESGSGTRGAFIELFGIEEKGADGKKVDKTTAEAEELNDTGSVMTTVAGNKAAIGYISLGSLKDTVKALKIDGAEASVANVKNGTYKISRPFNVAYKDGLSDTAQDFLEYILSKEGQDVVEASGYIRLDDAAAYAGSKPAGTVKVSGSTSVSPLMEKIVAAYKTVNPNATVTVQSNDSSQGMTDAADGLSDIGMASREIKDTELAKGLTGVTIATDGIAVIVHNDNEADGLTKNQVKEIYTGAKTKWSQVK